MEANELRQGEDRDGRDSWRSIARAIAAGANTCLAEFPVTPILRTEWNTTIL